MMTSKLEGFPVNISGREYILSPLSYDEYVSIVPPCYVRTDPVEFTITVVNVGVRVIHASLSRNYPDMTIDQVREILHLGSAETMADTIRNAFLDLGNAILNSLTGVFEKMATTAIQNMIMEQIGVTTTKKAEAVSSITASAAEAGAGAMAAMAGIPYVGPALAAAAGPETYAAAIAYLPLAIAEGGWDVDRGGLSMIHSKEMVLPSDLAEGVRGMVRGGGSPRGSAAPVIHNHIQSWDSRDMGQFMKRNGRAMLTSLAYSARAWGVR